MSSTVDREAALQKLAQRGLRADDAKRFFVCVAEGQVQKVRLYLDAGMDPETRDPGHSQRRTALYLAADEGHLNVARALIQAGANIDARCIGKQTPLGAAISSMGLWAKGRKARDPQATAAFERNAEVARLLLASGANPNLADTDGYTPLMKATHAGDVEIARLLLEAGANVAAVAKNGFTALGVAAVEGRRELMELYLDAGAPVNAKRPKEQAPIACAVYSKQPDLVRCLVSRGADPSGNVGQAWLACVHANDPAMAELLLELGADPRWLGEPLATAAIKGHTELVRVFLRAGAPLEERERRDGSTPLLAACVHMRPEILDLLLEAGADANAQDSNGRTALSVARERSYTGTPSDPVVQAMADRLELHLAGGKLPQAARRTQEADRSAGEDFRTESEQAIERLAGGFSPLTRAAMDGSLAEVKTALQSGTELDARDPDGSTALDRACLGGHRPIVGFLLGRGAKATRNTEAAASVRRDSAISVMLRHAKNGALARRLKALDSRNAQTRVIALVELENAARDGIDITLAIPAVAKALSDSDENCVWWAARVFRMALGPDADLVAAVPALARALEKPRKKELFEACFIALGRAAEAGADLSVALPALAERFVDAVPSLLGSKDAEVRQATVRTLWQAALTGLDFTAVLPAVAALLQDPDPKVAQAADGALKAFAGQDAGKADLVERLLREDLAQGLATYALQLDGDRSREARQALRDAATQGMDLSLYVPALIAASRRFIGAKEQALVAEALVLHFVHHADGAELARLVAAQPDSLGWEVMEALARFEAQSSGLASILPDLLRELGTRGQVERFKDGLRKVLAAHVRTDPRRLPGIAEILARTPHLLRAVVDDLAGAGVDLSSALPWLFQCLASEAAKDRADAAYALRQLRHKLDLALHGKALRSALRDPDERVRTCVLQILAGLRAPDPDPASTIQSLRAALRDSEWRIRRDAALALGNLLLKAELPDWKSLDALRTDPDPGIRNGVLASFDDCREVGAGQAYSRLALGLLDESDLNRTRAANGLLSAEQNGTTAPLQDETLAALVRALEDPARRVRIEETLGAYATRGGAAAQKLLDVAGAASVEAAQRLARLCEGILAPQQRRSEGEAARAEDQGAVALALRELLVPGKMEAAASFLYGHAASDRARAAQVLSLMETMGLRPIGPMAKVAQLCRDVRAGRQPLPCRICSTLPRSWDDEADLREYFQRRMQVCLPQTGDKPLYRCAECGHLYEAQYEPSDSDSYSPAYYHVRRVPPAEAFGRLGADDRLQVEEEMPRVLSRLRAELRHPDPAVHRAAVDTLAGQGAAGKDFSDLNEALLLPGDDERDVRRAALNWLAERLREADSDRLELAALEPALRRIVAEAAARSRGLAARLLTHQLLRQARHREIEELLDSADDEILGNALWALFLARRNGLDVSAFVARARKVRFHQNEQVRFSAEALLKPA